MVSTELIIGVCFVIFTSLIFIVYYLLSSHKQVLNSVESLTEHVTNIPIQGFDKNGNILLWNRASEMTYGYTRADVLGKNIKEVLLVEGEEQQFVDNIRQVYKTKKPLPPRQWIMVAQNGHQKAIYSTMFPYVSDGKCEYVLCIEVDITEIKDHEQQITGLFENYKSIFDSVNESISVVDPDSGKVMDANENFCALLGYSKEEVLKLRIHDLSYGDKKEVEKRIKDDTSKVFYEGPQHFSWLGLKKTGEVFECEITLKKGLVDKRNCIIASVRDVSKRKTVESQLKRANKRYSDLLINTSSLIFDLDNHGIITSVNSAANKVLKYKKEQIIGKNFTDFMPTAERVKAKSIFDDIIKGAENKDEELIFLTKDNQEVHILLNVWPLFNDKGDITGVCGVAKDITEQKRVLEKMRQMVIQIVSMLSETVSVADRYTEKHCERLQDLSLMIGAELDLSEAQLEHLKFASLLHDVGKVGVPIHILLKKEKLTEDEWNAIKEHPKKGADIVRQLSGFEDVALIIEQHQERIDGKGYPLGLKKDQIKKEATIISVVDAFDAMTSDRPYRKAMPIQKAIEELKKNAGSQFDKEVVEAFVRILEKNPDVNK